MLLLGAIGCGPLPQPEELESGEGPALGVVRQAGVERQGVERQGVERQGVERQGTSFEDVSHAYNSFKLDGQPLTDVQVYQGELRACGRYPVSTPAASTKTCYSRESGLARNCGWRVDEVGSCKPGQTVAVGAGCAKLGSSSGNGMLRICDGTSTCDFGGKGYITSNDNGANCGYNPLATFTCPASGLYTVMTAQYSSVGYGSVSPAASTGRLPACDLKTGGELKDAYLQGRDEAGNLYDFHIVGVEAEDYPLPTGYAYTAGSTFLYTLEYLDPKAGTWEPFCATDPVDATRRVAIPQKGVWNKTGARADSTTHFTFACTGGVLAKCYRWGYRPWLMGTGQDMVKQHWACTRMARADYCGDGTPHTVSGTAINMWDRVTPAQVQVSTPMPDLTFEAGWTTYGALCLSHERWKNLPDTLDPRTQCPDQLLDPGMSWPSKQQRPTVCDSEADATTFYPSADIRLFNDSSPTNDYLKLDGGT